MKIKTGKFQKNKLEFIKNPSVLEFLGLPGNTGYSEAVIFVLIDLKTSRITHQDVGQMDMYVRMYDELKRNEGAKAPGTEFATLERGLYLR
jgi:predicted nuclease of restriction endonuclease-like (RecB) superfamily